MKLREALFERFAALGAPFGIERSLKLTPGALLADRVLLSLHKSSLGADPAGGIAALCDGLAMPAAARAFVAREIAEADVVHVGLEAGGGACICKVYLEQAARARARLADSRRDADPVVVHRAVKWDQARPKGAVVAVYTALPGLRGAAVSGAMAAAFPRAGDAPCRTAVHLYDRARGRIAARDLTFLQVEEEGTARRSFALTVYGAGLTMGDVAPHAPALAAHFALTPADTEQFGRLLGRDELGNIAGGLGRGGAEFLTLYFGVRSGDRPEARAATAGAMP